MIDDRNEIRCDGCAFSSGTRANRDDRTQLVIQLCVEARNPFYCHDYAHELQRNGLPQSAAIDRARDEGRFPLCAGYVEAVARLNQAGYYRDDNEWKRNLAKRSIALMDDAEDRHLTDDEACEEFKRMVGDFLQVQPDA